MKPIKYISLAGLLLVAFNLFAQTNDTTAIFKVYGACEMCKERVEKTLKVRGVEYADWNINTKMLRVHYNSSVLNLSRIQKLLTGAGHDTEHEKARDIVYNEMPACCHYREIETRNPDPHRQLQMISNDTSNAIIAGHNIKGVVLEETKKGTFLPLIGASVVWLGTTIGTVTDTSGVFTIEQFDMLSRLVISYSGYASDTISINDRKGLKIVLASGKQLSEVKVFSRQRSTYAAALSPIRTQVMTERELFKAACCNLSESFETNPSVDVSYNDAVTGSKQIQLLGLSGNYTQLTIENLPGPRGIATSLGLNSIAGPWVESIQLNKGVGSVVNGFESIAGQINVELKKPEKAERLYLNVYMNDMWKTDLNLNLSYKLGKKWSTALLLHDDFLGNKRVDFNKDGFRDLPTGNQFSAFNRWKYEDGRGLLTQFGFKILNDTRTGGENAFDKDDDKFTTRHYGLGIDIKRYEGFAKIGYVFPGKKYKSIGLQLSAFDHQHDSYFGLRSYSAAQHDFYANLIYQSIISTTAHKFRTGLSFVADSYKESFDGVNFKRTEVVPGAFFEYTFTPVENFNIVAGIRADRNSLFEWFVTPRLHIRYEPVTGTTIRVSAGRGQRTANIFAENTAVLVSSRQLAILSSSIDKAYGLGPEVAWNKGISLDQKFKMFNRDALFSLDYFRNDFSHQVIVDLENARQVSFYNLAGKSFSNSFQAEFNFEPARKLEARLAYRFFEVKTTYDGLLLQKPFTAKNRAFANLAYGSSGWKFDYTFNYNGAKRIPGTSANLVQYQRSKRSPSYVLMNAQVSKILGKKHPIEIYLGGENLTDYFQKDAIIAADAPFGNYFDAALIWGPVSGRLIYAGFRFKIK